MYDIICGIGSLLFNEIWFLSIKSYYNISLGIEQNIIDDKPDLIE